MRIPPHSLPSEVGCLAGVFADWTAWYEVATILTATDFYSENHRRVFAAMKASADASETGAPDYFGIRAAMVEQGTSDQIPPGFLEKIGAMSVGAVDPARLARGVRACSIRRAAIAKLATLQDEAYDTSTDVETWISASSSEIEALAPAAFESVVPAKIALQEAFAVYEAAVDGRVEPTIPTGITDLDQLLSGGWRYGELVAWGGATGMGKTSSAIGFLRACCRSGGSAYAAITEMNRKAYTLRIIAQEAGVCFTALRDGKLDGLPAGRVIDAMARMSEWRFFLDDDASLSAERVALRARQIKHRHGLDLVIADYYQRLRPHPKHSKPGQKVEGLTHIAETLQKFARESEVAVIATAQVKKEASHRRPEFDDIAWCQALAYEATVVGYTYREAKADPDKSSDPRRAEYLLRKVRNSAEGVVHVGFHGDAMRFHDLSEIEPGPRVNRDHYEDAF